MRRKEGRKEEEERLKNQMAIAQKSKALKQKKRNFSLTLSSSPTSILRSASTAGASTFAGAAMIASRPSAAAALALAALDASESAARGCNTAAMVAVDFLS